jgi:hypothetical protein
MKLGNSSISKCYLGSTVVNKIYQGATEAYSNVTLPPFDYDSNTYWWDFRNTQTNNLIDTLGDDTMAYAYEYITGTVYKSFDQANKSRQPLIKTNGIDFNQLTTRKMELIDKSDICNATSGWYCAFNLNPTTATLRVLSIGGATGTNALRGELDVTGSRLVRVRINANDGGTQTSLGLSPALTLGTWYTVEVQVNISGGTAVMSCWLNGTAQTLTSTATPAHNTTFPASSPTGFVLGNTLVGTGTQSLDGEIQQMVFYNGVPSSGIRSSISSYLVGIKP